ncbi:MAG: NAD(P)/FAD-dependent oxidoreductase [Paracoccaceae bacterium]
MTFPFALPSEPEHGGDLPAEADVVVIGGGVAGTSAALFLQQKGLRVVLLEKGRIAAEQSSRNWGWVRVQGRDPAEIPIALEARQHWAALDQRAGGRTGLKQVGVTYLAQTEKDNQGFQDWLKVAQDYQLDSRFLDENEVKNHLPNAQAKWPGALLTPSDMKAEPWQAVPELGRIAAEDGVVVRESCAARALDLEAGRVTGVFTEHGRIATNAVVLAAGAWSRLFLKRHGVVIPQLAVRSSAMATEPLPDVFGGAAADGVFSFRRREDGGYTVTPSGYSELFIGPDAFASFRAYLPVIRDPKEYNYHLRGPAPRGYPDAWGTPRRWAEDAESPFERMRILNPEPNRRKLDEIRDMFARIFPDVGDVRIKAKWAGMIDTLPDLLPVVDHVEALPGLTVCTGLSGHGFGIGTAYGRIVADLVTGGNVGHDLHALRMSRFYDGTKLLPGPGL